VQSLALAVPEAVWQCIDERATITNAFRYTDSELTGLADALYEISKRYRAKLSKQDVARFGLALVLADYQARGDKSLLVELAYRRTGQRAEEN
jgi:hypothetical protein